jgi:hypothetical protein
MTKRNAPIHVVHLNQPSHEALVRGARYLLDLTERKFGEEIRARVKRGCEAEEAREMGEAAP